MINHRLAREELVEHLQTRGIHSEKVLEAIRNVRRHEFVPAQLRSRAYEDVPLAIGEDQTISQPLMVARMTELLNLTGREKVLEIGTGSGYQAAVLAELCSKVFTVERLLPLAEQAKERFTRLAITNVIQKVGDGTLGWKEFAPYDCIIVTAGAPHIPQRLVDQLADGGRLVIPTGPRRVQDLKLIIKHGHKTHLESKGGCVFVPLVGTDGWGSE